ncbi:MAG: arylsulfatase [Planctomycetaceae bacterium]
MAVNISRAMQMMVSSIQRHQLAFLLWLISSLPGVGTMGCVICMMGHSAIAAASNKPAARPNILVVLADDLGYSDLGCFGSEISTPHLDALAANGLRLTQFYNTARCWPTRAALMTGYYAQQVRRDALPGTGGGGGNRNRRPEWARLLPDMLTPAGYRSYHSGKWHLDGKPLESGFHRSYLLQDQGRFFNPQKHFEDDVALPAVPKNSGFYGTTAIADHAVRCLKEHQQQHADKPFFHYLAFTAPHFPLHALPEDIAKYKDRYRNGWEQLRAQRYSKQQSLGLHEVRLSQVERQLGPPYHFPDHLQILGDGEVNRPLPWDELTAEQQAFQADKMALHAAMIDRMDQELGKVLQQLKDMQVFDNTLILFLSDNGASAEIMVRDDGHDATAEPGSAETYLCLGPGWSTTCNTPFRRHKTWVHEGGISTPLIVHWPNGISAKGELRNSPGHVIDIVPTILDVCEVKPLTQWNGSAIPAAPGRSLRPLFTEDVRPPHDFLWWFHDGHKAVRMGDWKLVAPKDEPWELYDLSVDRAEQNNLASQDPDRVQRLSKRWQATVEEFQTLLAK